ncbi:MAG TPA: phosphoenolpyruvate--protein phosphotransferase [Victivallales bacterium]|nr:phosphoenolpyruvate--protein phosphotransferase [Victivallales bacterium]
MINKLFDILKNISDIIANNSDTKSILGETVLTLAKGLDAKVCSVYVFDKDMDALVLTATHGLKKESIGKVKMKSGEGLTGICFRDNEILNIINPENHHDFKYFASTGEEIYKSYLSVPLVIAGKCLGILVIQGDEPKKFTENIVDTARSISTQLASLILNTDILTALANNPSEKDNYNSSPNIPDISQTISGISGNTGIAIGKALIFQSSNILNDIVPSKTDTPDKELTVLSNAITITKKKIIALEEKALTQISEADASIFYAHLLFLEDKTLLNEIKRGITTKKRTAEYSIKRVFNEYKKRFSLLKNEDFKDKIMDLKDVLIRLIITLNSLKKNNIYSEDIDFTESQNYILIAKELLPSDLLKLPANNIKGIICEKGGVAAHIAILARAFDIPALLKTPNITNIANKDDDIILDCFTETAYIRPDQKIKTGFNDIIKSRLQSAQNSKVDTQPAITLDNKNIKLNANLALVNEVSLLQKYGADGIGLYRTEFLYMIRDRLPSEREQYQIFSKVLKEAKGKTVTIRLLDVGADKPLPYIHTPYEDNPALGNRGIRFLLNNDSILRSHLRAILRAGRHGKLKILIPMISNKEEIIRLKEILVSVRDKLIAQNSQFSTDYELGIMLEVPSVLFDIENMISEVDFVSIGTNDLLQYIFAADRTNEVLPNKFLPLHPIFLKVLKNIGSIFANYPDKELSLCGEIAGNVYAVPYILGAGIYEFSMPPKFIPLVKEVINSIRYEDSKRLLDTAITFNNTDSTLNLIDEFFKINNLTKFIKK